jgi:hypothetical protein
MINLDQYLPILLFILVGVAIGVIPQVLGYILGPNRPDAAKNSPYECGFEAFEDARMKFDVRYYLVAILFNCVSLPLGCCSSRSGYCRLRGRPYFPEHSGCRFCLRMEKGCA